MACMLLQCSDCLHIPAGDIQHKYDSLWVLYLTGMRRIILVQDSPSIFKAVALYEDYASYVNMLNSLNKRWQHIREEIGLPGL